MEALTVSHMDALHVLITDGAGNRRRVCPHFAIEGTSFWSFPFRKQAKHIVFNFMTTVWMINVHAVDLWEALIFDTLDESFTTSGNRKGYHSREFPHSIHRYQHLHIQTPKYAG